VLILHRTEGERVLLYGDGMPKVAVKIDQIVGQSVRLGFEAPDGVRIYREEVAERIRTSGPKSVYRESRLERLERENAELRARLARRERLLPDETD
jgi:carbon storage regulator CsrA